MQRAWTVPRLNPGLMWLLGIVNRWLLLLGLPDRFIDHGDPALLLKQCGLDAEGIAQSIRTRFGLTLTVAHGLKKTAG